MPIAVWPLLRGLSGAPWLSGAVPLAGLGVGELLEGLFAVLPDADPGRERKVVLGAAADIHMERLHVNGLKCAKHKAKR